MILVVVVQASLVAYVNLLSVHEFYCSIIPNLLFKQQCVNCVFVHKEKVDL